MKHLKPPTPKSADPQAAGAQVTARKRRTAFRFGFSAVIASFVVLAMLIFGAMFQEEYEEGFVRIVSFAVRLATPEEVAEAEAQGPIPDPLPSIRPDTPVAVISEPLIILGEVVQEETVAPVPEALIPLEDLVMDTPQGLLLLPQTEPQPSSETSNGPPSAEPE